MEIRPATIKEAKSVLTHPEIYETITSDGAPKVEDYAPPEAVYIGGYVNGEIIGVFVFHPKSNIVWQLHIQVLPEHRKKYANKFCKNGINWFWDNSNVLRLCAEIPSKYPNVLQFAMKNGFQIDGRIDRAYLKNNELYSIYYLSLERPR